ncbi:MAG: transcription elongation factor GreA [Mycoplasmataceae bacterium]|nr:transcription elongation factor GreA [Mycoplasmataceae bacterium]
MVNKKINVSINLDDSNKIELTSQGKKDLEKELRELIDISRPAIQKELAEARAQGDLSENAEYDSAKNKQAEIESNILKIENMLTRAKIIKTIKNSNKVNLGSEITYKKGTEKLKVILVPKAEYNPLSEIIKVGANSPFAQSVMGAEVGDKVTIKTENPYKITILKID